LRPGLGSVSFEATPSMASKTYRPRERLPATKHADLMRAMFPALRLRRRGSEFVWTGPLQPTEASAIYTVSITYADGSIPRVRVLSPMLTPRPGADRVPHTYDAGARLCLYAPLGNEWQSTRPISLTIVPWTCLWLYYYELWHATGDWLGGGHDPNGGSEEGVSHEAVVSSVGTA